MFCFYVFLLYYEYSAINVACFSVSAMSLVFRKDLCDAKHVSDVEKLESNLAVLLLACWGEG